MDILSNKLEKSHMRRLGPGYIRETESLLIAAQNTIRTDYIKVKSQ